jgi:hypothetical protein
MMEEGIPTSLGKVKPKKQSKKKATSSQSITTTTGASMWKEKEEFQPEKQWGNE